MRKAVLCGLLALIVGLGFSGPAFAEEGITDTEILLGSHQDFSGPIAMWGIQQKMGAELRIKEVNDAGGIHGRKIRAIFEDNGYDPKKAIMATNKLISRDKVFMFFQNQGSVCAAATKPIISAKKIPQFFPSAANRVLYDPYDRYCMMGWTPYQDETRASTEYFITKKKYTKFGSLYQDDEMGVSMHNGVVDQLAVHNMKPVAVENYKRGATDFSTQVARLKKADVEIIMLGTIVRETVNIMKEVRKLGWKVDLCGPKTAATQAIIDLSLASGFSPEGYYASAQSEIPYPDTTDEVVKAYIKRFKDLHGVYPDASSYGGYEAIDYFAKVAEKVGKDLTREKWIDAAHAYGWYHFPMGGVPVMFTSTDHQGSYDAILTQVRNGRYVKIADISYRNKK